ncbi:neuronal acetylcholine receptor subunit beta-3-like [Trichogramma pretiosum]|uniref:neuronal acetylcholine receptor subunit beta-3-like n=1 Tax=Trichogramma pretiosum TaxID=7493 RepID=UPI0006C96E60|nr:neuronal acetylcholine receptor subunit beta-3-like [Trichogramma pretiosum]
MRLSFPSANLIVALALPLLLIVLSVANMAGAASIFDRDAPECKILSDKSPELRLKLSLFCKYDKSVRPVISKSTPINVTVGLSPKFMEFDSDKNQFILHSWMLISWKDEHLGWDPDDYDGVDSLRIESDDLWLPDISVFNSGDLSVSQSTLLRAMCKLSYTGLVVCVPALKFVALCSTDYANWPYDLQNCFIFMGSWTQTGAEVNFNFRRKSINMSSFQESKLWLVTNYTSRKVTPKLKNDSFPFLSFQFEIQRHSGIIQAVYISPLIVLAILTLTLLWLDSRSTERLILAAVIFICHLLCLYNLHWLIPSNGLTPPHVLLFYRDSMIITTFAIVLTTLLRKLQSTRGIPAPIWIESSVSFVANNPAGRWLLLEDWPPGNSKVIGSEDDREPIEAMPMKTDNWRRLALIIDWLALFAVIFTYLLLFLSRIPRVEYKKSIL